MNKHERHPATYMCQEDLATPQTFTIDRVAMELIDNGDGGGKREKPVARLREKGSKPWVINRVNDEILSAAFGPDDENWRGKRIELFVDKTIMFGGRRVGGIRVRIPEERIPF